MRKINRKALALGVALRYVPFLSLGVIAEHTLGEPPEDVWTTLIHMRLLAGIEDCLAGSSSVALMLSGGIDSALIAGILAQYGHKDIPAVTVSFQERSYDEYAQAAIVAKKCGLEHVRVLVEEDTVEEAVTLALSLPDEPFADPSLVPMLILSKAVREIADTALAGDGGDELFGGYPTFPATRFHRFLNRFPIKGMFNTLTRFLPVSHEQYNLRYKLRRFNRGLGLPPERAFIAWLLTADQEELSRILVKDELDVVESLYSLVEHINESELTKLMSKIYLRLFLPGGLKKVELASTYYGLEVRTPFLQPEMIDLALSLPARARVKGFKTKPVLRKLAGELGLDNRMAKRGFNIPLSQWIRGRLRPLVEPYLTREALEAGGFFKSESVIGIWWEHLTGKENHFDLLWSIINTQKFLLLAGGMK